MYTREELARRRAAVQRIENGEGRILAILAVGLGVAQLGLLRWAEAHLAHRAAVGLSGIAFLVYLALLLILLVRMRRHQSAVRPRCPQCKASLEGVSERIAMASGRCDACGGAVVEGE